MIKLLAICERTAGGRRRAGDRLGPGLPGDDPGAHPLAAVDGAFNAVFVEAEAAGQLMFYGQGAGGAPTASAVLGDLMAVARNRVVGGRGPRESAYASLPVRPIGDGAHALPRQPGRGRPGRRAVGDRRRVRPPRGEHRRGPPAASLADGAESVGSTRVVVAALDGWDPGGLKTIAAAIAARPGHVALLVSTPAPSAIVVARAPDVAVDSGAILKQMTATFGGKGGGRPELAQGGGLLGTPDEMLRAARALMQPSSSNRRDPRPVHERCSPQRCHDIYTKVTMTRWTGTEIRADPRPVRVSEIRVIRVP